MSNAPAPAALSARGITKAFGGLKAVSDFTLDLPRGGLYGLIGPNGAGKTTIFNMLTGVYRPDRGEVRVDGRVVSGLRPHRITHAGLARTFQNIRLFGELSVLENVMVGFTCRSRQTLFSAIARTARQRNDERQIRARALDLLALFGLADRAEEPARSLPYGAQRRLEVARALATEPRVLLLDEPAAGMNPQEKIALRGLVQGIRRNFELSILLIEHDMGVVMDVCERITVVDHGVIIAEGAPAEIQRDARVIEAYLGVPTSQTVQDHGAA